MNYDILLYKAMFDFIKAIISSEDIYKANTNFAAPVGPYSVIRVGGPAPISWTAGAREPPEDITGKEKTYSIYSCELFITFFGEFSLARAQALSNAFTERALTKILSDQGVGYSSRSSVTDISRNVDGTEIEEAANIVVKVYFAQGGTERGDDPSVIETSDGVTPILNP